MNSDGSPLTFSSLNEGVSALQNYVNNAMGGTSNYYSPNETLAQFENTYTGGDPNAANNIASMLGVSPSIPMSSLSDQNLGSVSSGVNVQPKWWKWLLPGSTVLNDAGQAAQNMKSQASGLLLLGRLLEPQNTAAFLIGLILVAAAVFGIDKVQDTAITTAKRGAEIASA